MTGEGEVRRGRESAVARAEDRDVHAMAPVAWSSAIFTFGMLLMLEGGAPPYLFTIPLLWSLAGGSAAVFILRTPEDVSLLIAGVVGSCMLVWKRRQQLQRVAANYGTHRT